MTKTKVPISKRTVWLENQTPSGEWYQFSNANINNGENLMPSIKKLNSYTTNYFGDSFKRHWK